MDETTKHLKLVQETLAIEYQRAGICFAAKELKYHSAMCRALGDPAGSKAVEEVWQKLQREDARLKKQAERLVKRTEALFDQTEKRKVEFQREPADIPEDAM